MLNGLGTNGFEGERTWLGLNGTVLGMNKTVVIAYTMFKDGE